MIFVTCFYDISLSRVIWDTYLNNFKIILSSGIPIILFIDDQYVSKFENVKNDDLTIVVYPFNTFKVHKKIMDTKPKLPTIRNNDKDTIEYLTLMNCKVEMLKIASEKFPKDMLMWIDFGIMKIISNHSKFIQDLRLINEKLKHRKYMGIIIPGMQPTSTNINVINWRFCGGIVLIHATHSEKLYTACYDKIQELLKQKIITWEVNIWSLLELDDPNLIKWVSGNHNDDIIKNILPIL